MTCDTGANGAQNGPWVAELSGRDQLDHVDGLANWESDQGMWDNPLEFALFGLARQAQFPEWIKTDWTKPILDLGPGNKIIQGAIRCEYPEYNFESIMYNPPVAKKAFGTESGEFATNGFYDPNSMYRQTLPYADNSVGGIYAVNILEHLWDPRPIMEECARVLAPGAPLNIVVPHGSHGIYLQDLDHKKPFILDTWKNWLQNGYWGPDRSHLHLRVGANFKFGIKEENVNIMTQLIKSDDPWEYATGSDEVELEGEGPEVGSWEAGNA